MWTSLPIYLLLLSVDSSAEAHSPRMLFTHKETAAKRLPLPGHHVPVRVILGTMDNVISVGQTHVKVFSSQNPEKSPVEKKLVLKHCSNKVDRGCNYSISVVHQRDEAEHVFVCGSNGQETKCCDMDVSLDSPVCVSEKLQNINDKMGNFAIKEGEHSVVTESQGARELYITFSGAQGSVGLHKFGGARVRPGNHDKEEYYVGLMLSRRDDQLQDKVYAFFKQKNRDTELYSEMWLPFVSQVCMSDIGGPKNNLQSSWTSQMKARLFCGDPESRQHFSELVDVATVHGDSWQDTKVYALFRNEWGMSAMCIYAIRDIDHIFTKSPLKGSTSEDPIERPRECVPDSTKLPSDVLWNIQKASEMEQWVKPVNNAHPLLFNHHNYTRIYVDASQHKGNSPHIVTYLSLNDGRIHKVVQNEKHSFTVAEYTPFEQSAHILGVILHPSTRKLYVNTRSELVQLDVANCAQYGNTCEECVLSRDPYCGWSNTHCSSETGNSRQDVTRGDPAICSQTLYLHNKAFPEEDPVSIKKPFQSKFFLCCPVTSQHARYTWETADGNSVNCSYMDKECLLQINSMSPEQVGNYKCVSKERGYRKVLAEYNLQMRSTAAAAGRTFSPALWVCVMGVLINSFCS